MSYKLQTFSSTATHDLLGSVGKILGIRQDQPKSELRRLIQFLIVGGLGTMLDFGLLIAFKHGLGLSTSLANGMSYAAGTANNFALNRAWTYRDTVHQTGSKAAATQLLQFAVVSLVGLLLNIALVMLLEAPIASLLHLPDSAYLVAKGFATVIVFLWNYSINRLWTFNAGTHTALVLTVPSQSSERISS